MEVAKALESKGYTWYVDRESLTGSYCPPDNSFFYIIHNKEYPRCMVMFQNSKKEDNMATIYPDIISEVIELDLSDRNNPHKPFNRFDYVDLS